MSCEQLFTQQLRERGFRMTPQREIILSVMHDLEALATADAIYSRVRGINSAVDISTVYRTLDLLQEFDLVSCVDVGGSQRRYELLGVHGAHMHLVCQNCGQVIGVDADAVGVLGEYLRDVCGFQPALDHLTIPGLCKACAANPSVARHEKESKQHV